MTLLILGLIAWSSFHLIPSVAPAQRKAVAARLGEGPYMGLFSLAILGSLALIILGWRATEPVYWYALPAWSHHATRVLMLLTMLLLVATYAPSRIKRWVRHPQLSAVLLWSLAHLLSNGEQRSVLLFGGLGLWSVVSMVCINRRDGPWQKPDAPSLAKELIVPAVALVLYGVFTWAHPWLSGRSLL